MSIDSPRAPGREALIASAIWTMGASMQAYSTSWWCAAIAFTTRIERLWRWAIWAPMAACGPSTSWSTALPMSCSRPPILAIWTSAPTSAAMIAASRLGLDDVVQHVLAVARAVLEPADQLDDLGRQSRDAGVVGGLLAGLADDEVDLGARLGDDLLDPAGMDAAVLDELGQRDARDLAADRIEAADRTTVSGVSSMIRSMPVACSRARMLRPSRPMIRPFISSLGRWTTRDRVLGGVIGGDPLHGGDDDVARLLAGLVAGLALDRRGRGGRRRARPPRGPASRSRPFASSALRPLTRSSAAIWSCGRAGQLLAGLVELPLPVDELAVALLDHVGALVDLLVALEQPSLEVAQLAALRAGLVFCFALKAQLLVLGLEDQVLLLRPRALDDQGGLLLGLLDPLAREDAAAEETEYCAAGEGHEGHRHGHEFHVLLPSGLAACATGVTPAKGPEVMPMTDCGSPAGVCSRRRR